MSTVKRTRIARSSSLGDFAMVDQLRRPIEPQLRRPIEQPPVMRLDVKRTTPSVLQKKQPPLIVSKPPSSVFVDQKPRKTILTIGSPEREIGNAAESESKEELDRVGGFCEKCYSCKKKIGEKDKVFMYSYLRAFCSSKCRDKQIALDKKLGKLPDDSNGPNSMESQWILKMKKAPAKVV